MTTKINVSQSGAGEPTTAIPTFKGELYLNETDGSIWRAYGLLAGNWYLLQDALGYTAENIANKKTDLSDNSDTYYPTQKAVKTAIDEKVSIISYTNQLSWGAL